MIASLGYNVKTSILEIEFDSGAIWQYNDFIERYSVTDIDFRWETRITHTLLNVNKKAKSDTPNLAQTKFNSWQSILRVSLSRVRHRAQNMAAGH